MKRKSTQKLTPNQMAFKKELNRIKRFVRNARKKGFEFDDNVLPKQPKHVTRKKLEEIKNIKPSNLYDKAVYHDEISHEIFTGQQGRRIERHRASLKAKKTRKKNKEIRVKLKNPTAIKEKNLSGKKDNIINDGSEYYPTVDVIDEVGERLVNIDYVMGKLTDYPPDEDYRYIWKRESTANDYDPAWFYSNIWRETIQKYEEQNALSALEEYARDNALEITNCIDIVYWASKQEEIGNWQRLSSRLVVLLKAGEVPTLDEAQQLGELQEQNDLVSDSYED